MWTKAVGICNLNSVLIITCAEYMFVSEHASRFKLPSPGNPIREDPGVLLESACPGWVAMGVVTSISPCQNFAIEHPFLRWDVPGGWVEQS